MKINGNEVNIYLGGLKIAHSTAAVLTINNDSTEVASESDTRDYIPSWKTWDIRGNGFISYDYDADRANNSIMYDYYEQRKRFIVEVKGAGGIIYVGIAMIDSIDESFEMESTAQYTLNIKGCGRLYRLKEVYDLPAGATPLAIHASPNNDIGVVYTASSETRFGVFRANGSIKPSATYVLQGDAAAVSASVGYIESRKTWVVCCTIPGDSEVFIRAFIEGSFNFEQNFSFNNGLNSDFGSTAMEVTLKTFGEEVYILGSLAAGTFMLRRFSATLTQLNSYDDSDYCRDFTITPTHVIITRENETNDLLRLTRSLATPTLFASGLANTVDDKMIQAMPNRSIYVKGMASGQLRYSSNDSTLTGFANVGSFVGGSMIPIKEDVLLYVLPTSTVITFRVIKNGAIQGLLNRSITNTISGLRGARDLIKPAPFGSVFYYQSSSNTIRLANLLNNLALTNLFTDYVDN
jgi:hypothetical protein